MSPRSSSSAANDAGPQRLPFAAAEALLWGPEMKKQHQWLLQQMRELRTHHEAYDARIQISEAVAEAAEAATARIRHMEQQLTAMEAVDHENAFEKWTTAEINQLKAFQNDNKHVRQKQIELDKEVAGLADDMDRVRQAPNDLADLNTRVEFLISRQKEDADRIKSLEKEIAGLKSAGGRQPLTSMQNMRQPSYQRAMTPPRRMPILGEEENSETEDEDLFVLPSLPRKDARPGPEKAYIPASLETVKELDDLLGMTSAKLHPTGSARQRLFKRPSIHDSKLPRFLEEIRREEGAVPPGLPQRAAPVAPPTQLLHRGSPRKHKQSVEEKVIPHSTLPGVRSPQKFRQQRDMMKNMDVSEQPTQLVDRCPANPRKRVVDTKPPSMIQEDISKQPTQLVATSPRKKPRITAPTRPQKETRVAPSLPDAASSPKKKFIVVLQTQFGNTQVKKGDFDDTQQNAAESVKRSPRKAATKVRTCIPCRQRHVACDKAEPACGQCINRSPGQTCVYPPSHDVLVLAKKAAPSSPQKRLVPNDAVGSPSRSSKRVNAMMATPDRAVSLRKRVVRTNADAGPSGADIKASAAPSAEGSSSPSTIKPDQPSSSLRPREAKTRAAAAILTSSIRPRRRVHQDPADLNFDAFLKMKKENPKF